MDNGSPAVVTRSAGFADDWLPLTESLLVKFGLRVPGLLISPAIFATPINESHIGVVQVADSGNGLNFHVLVCRRARL